MSRDNPRPGTIARIGDHAIALGDAFDPDLRKRLLPERAAVTVTDPPFAIYGSSTGVASDVADDQMVRPFFREVAALAQAATTRNAHAYIFCDWRSYPALAGGARDVRLPIKNLLVWDKMRPGVGTHYQNQHELIAFAANTTVRDRMADVRQKQGIRPVPRSNVIRSRPVPPDRRLHNAEKPVALLQGLIQASSDPGEVVHDGFLGSASTILAAHRIGRVACGTEVDAKTWHVAVRRIEKELATTATLESPA